MGNPYNNSSTVGSNTSIYDLEYDPSPAGASEVQIQASGDGGDFKTTLQDIVTNVAAPDDIFTVSKVNVNDIDKSAITTTLAMTDGVVARIYPAVEAGVPDNWRFNSAASWYTETRNTGRYLGEYATNAAAIAVSGAAIGDYYYDTTDHIYNELDDLVSAETEIFRAGSAEFPAEIEIVSRDDYIFILDTKDGSMWMVFALSASSTSAMIGINTSTIGSAVYRNGLLVLVTETSGDSAREIDFIRDTGHKVNDTDTRRFKGSISQRNNAAGYQVTDTSRAILSNTVKAVAIGDASKDYGYDSWGVPRQYIAVGCDTTNGVSVIHPNGKVYDITGQTDLVNSVEFNQYGELITTGDRTYHYQVHDIPFRDIDESAFIREGLQLKNGDATAASFPRIWIDTAVSENEYERKTIDNKVILGSSDGNETFVTIFDEDIYGAGTNIDGSDSPASYIGYDSVLTEHFISPLVDRLVSASLGTEIGTTDLVESNLNGSQANAAGDDTAATTGWTAAGSATLSSQADAGAGSTNVIEILGTANNSAASIDVQVDLGATNGKPYLVSFDAKHTGSGGDWNIGFSSNADLSASFTTIVTLTSADTTYKRYNLSFTGGTFRRYFGGIENSGTDDGGVRIDNVRVLTAIEDRSQLNSNHAGINGTITRTAYDSGDVVMHSGAVLTSGINTGAYWELGYDVFATDGVLFDGWIDWDSVSDTPLISNRALDGSNNPVVSNTTPGSNGSTLILGNDDIIRLKDDTGAAFTNNTIATGVTAGLHHIIIILSSTDFYVYIDGELNQVTASVTLTTPTDAITYIHPDNMALPRVGGIDRKATADYYRWLYKKERRLFDNGAEATLQGTGNVVDISVDPVRKQYTVLQTDHYTTFDEDGIVATDGAVSNTGVSVSTYDGDISILDGANLTLTTRARSVSNSLIPVDRVKEKRTIEYDSLVEADSRIFGASLSNPPTTSGDTVGGSILDWDGSEGSALTRVTDGMLTLFDDQAGDYLLTFTVANRSAGTITWEPLGDSGTARSADGTYTETITHDPAANTSQAIIFNPANSGFDGQVSDYRIRPVGTPFWISKGWRPETIWEDGSKVRPDTPDLTRDGSITRRFDGKYGWMSTTDTWNTISIEVVEIKL